MSAKLTEAAAVRFEYLTARCNVDAVSRLFSRIRQHYPHASESKITECS